MPPEAPPQTTVLKSRENNYNSKVFLLPPLTFSTYSPLRDSPTAPILASGISPANPSELLQSGAASESGEKTETALVTLRRSKMKIWV